MKSIFSTIFFNLHNNGAHTAMVIDKQAISYHDFNQVVNFIAKKIINTKHQVIYIYAEKTVISYAAIIAVIKSGRCFVPLNPDFPKQRLVDILHQVGLGVLIADYKKQKEVESLIPLKNRLVDIVLFDQLEVFKPTENIPFQSPDGESPLYILFTSGSTGSPKGITISYRNAHHYIHKVNEILAILKTDKLSQHFELNFDLAIHDILLSFYSGACLCVPSFLDKLFPANYIKKHQITVWFSVPSMIQQMHQMKQLTANTFASLRLSLFCGEALSTHAARYWQAAAPSSLLFNLYGPTEATIAFTYFKISTAALAADDSLIPIGQPFLGLSIKIIDKENKVIKKAFVEGELCLAGDQLSIGYLNNPEQTKQAFYEDTQDKKRWYKTGDIVHYNQQDQLVFKYRKDTQIKLNGYRIELTEIQSSIERAFAGIHCALLFKNNNIIVFYVVPHGTVIEVKQLIDHCQRHLPRYSVPQHWHELACFPRNDNGKIDFIALHQMIQHSLN